MKKKYFTKTDLITIGIVIIIFSTILTSKLLTSDRSAPKQKLCMNNLKALGVGMTVYLNDNYTNGDHDLKFPYNHGFSYISMESIISKQFNLEKEELICPATRTNDNSPVYILVLGIEGKHINEFENDWTPIMEDGNQFGKTENHKQGNTRSILFGDGHVETKKVEP